jgi:hypothetical protein
MVTNGALNYREGESVTGRVVVFVKGTPDVAIFAFVIGKQECSVADFVFGGGQIVEFRSAGADVAVDISGYLRGGYSIDIEEVSAE